MCNSRFKADNPTQLIVQNFECVLQANTQFNQTFTAVTGRGKIRGLQITSDGFEQPANSGEFTILINSTEVFIKEPLYRYANGNQTSPKLFEIPIAEKANIQVIAMAAAAGRLSVSLMFV